MKKSFGYLAGLFLATATAAMMGVDGCADAQPQYPPLNANSCSGGSCSSPPSSVSINGGANNGVGGAGNGAAGASGNGGGSGGSAGAATVIVSAMVNVVNDTTFVSTTPSTRPANITASTPDSVVVGTWDGSTTVTLQNVLAGGANWISVEPTDAATDIRGTLNLFAFDGSATAVSPVVVQLPVVSQDVLTAVLSQLSTPATLDKNAPQVVAFFQNAQGKPAQGVTVSSDATATIGYDQGSGFGGTKTGSLGIAVLLNVTAAGTSMKLSFLSSMGGTTAVTVQLANQKVSVLKLIAP